tara:strand:+ start:7295 stop:7966 length:672 start_codon:yes stop_codon:yes gene_type:complete
MTIDEIYKFVKLMANKENRGWIKPTEFNLLAKRSQLDLIKERVGVASQDGSQEGYRENSRFYDELYPVITYNQGINSEAGSDDFEFPTNPQYLYFLGARFNDREVEMLDHGDLTRRRNSELNPPSDDFPCAIIQSGGIRMFNTGGPSVGGLLRLTYISEPADPVWAFNTVNNIEIYNASTSTNLVLPESTHKEIAHRILAYIGVTLRESNIVEYGTTTVIEKT